MSEGVSPQHRYILLSAGEPVSRQGAVWIEGERAPAVVAYTIQGCESTQLVFPDQPHEYVTSEGEASRRVIGVMLAGLAQPSAH